MQLKLTKEKNGANLGEYSLSAMISRLSQEPQFIDFKELVESRRRYEGVFSVPGRRQPIRGLMKLATPEQQESIVKK
jgi:hypothetical protein